jgi:ankyrin repeat protein
MDIDTTFDDDSSRDFCPDEQLEFECGIQYQRECNEVPSVDISSNYTSTSNGEQFVLPWKYLQEDGEYPTSAVLEAAADPDARILGALLGYLVGYCRAVKDECFKHWVRGERYEPSTPWGTAQAFLKLGVKSIRVADQDIGITTPLMEAIWARLPENVRTLLEAGAEPNGIPQDVVETYSSFFLRFRPLIPPRPDKFGDVASRDTLLSLTDLEQLAPLTFEEVEDRFVDGMAPFWCEESFTPRDFYPCGASLSSLIAAAQMGSIEIFDQLRSAGANSSFWMTGCADREWFKTCLCISTPLHSAIEGHHTNMVNHLLNLGFDPNIMPTANPTRCVTPLMATITACHNHVLQPFNKEVFDILISHPKIDTRIRTPIYGVHLLHFAVARLNLDMLKHVVSRLHYADGAITALGHNLLHIACMPANSLYVQRHSEIVFRSIHETRDLSFSNDRFPAPETAFPNWTTQAFYTNHFPAQAAVVKYLWEQGIRDLDAKDVHGNTPLHYLAGCHIMNHQLLNWWLIVLKDANVERIWKESRNAVGATPKDLYLEAEKVRIEGNFGWKPWFERKWRSARVERKESIWKWLLENRVRGLGTWRGRGRGRGGLRGRKYGRGTGRAPSATGLYGSAFSHDERAQEQFESVAGGNSAWRGRGRGRGGAAALRGRGRGRGTRGRVLHNIS